MVKKDYRSGTDMAKEMEARNKELEARSKERRAEIDKELIDDGQSTSVNTLDVTPAKIEEIAGEREGEIEQVDIQAAVSRVHQKLFEEMRDLNREQDALEREQRSIYGSISTINTDPDETPATTR